MSRVAKNPIHLPSGVDVKIESNVITIKGAKGTLQKDVHPAVKIDRESNTLHVKIASDAEIANAISGTMRALVQNMVNGVTQGYECKLTLVGVGYRAQVQGKNLNLTLGFSHPVNFPIPTGITIETPTQTEVVVKGADKELVMQVAANIRAYRPPEPYKGKGVRYANEVIILKEGKKK